MKSKPYIKSSSYNKGKKDAIILIEAKTKLASVKKEKSRLSTSLADLTEFSDYYFNYKEKFLCDISTFSTDYYLNKFDSLIEPNSNPLLIDDSWLRSNLVEKINTNIFLSHSYFGLNDVELWTPTKNRASEINDELRILKIEVKQAPSARLFLKIKQLVQELHSLVNFSFRKHTKNVKYLQKFLNIVFTTDLRNLFRKQVRSLFKYFNDFSGSEEDDFVHINRDRINFFNITNRKSCIIKMKLLNQLTYTLKKT